MEIKTWADLNREYPESREEMTEERERDFVAECFRLYESEGFVGKFWSPYSDYKDRFGECFEIVGRCEEGDYDLCVLPMWLIKFQDGTIVGAYPEEIIPSERTKLPCPY